MRQLACTTRVCSRVQSGHNLFVFNAKWNQLERFERYLERTRSHRDCLVFPVHRATHRTWTEPCSVTSRQRQICEKQWGPALNTSRRDIYFSFAKDVLNGQSRTLERCSLALVCTHTNILNALHSYATGGSSI